MAGDFRVGTIGGASVVNVTLESDRDMISAGAGSYEPVDRRVRGGLVEQAIERFRTRPQWVLAIAPEGTRKRVEQWKTGFYRIAIGAGVPVLPVAIDFSKKALDLGTLYWPVGDETQDLAALRARYHAGMAKFPGEYGG